MSPMLSKMARLPLIRPRSVCDWEVPIGHPDYNCIRYKIGVIPNADINWFGYKVSPK